MYAIEFTGYGNFRDSDYTYYTGKSFRHQGVRYAVESSHAYEAKKYTSEKRAVAAAEKMLINFENCWKNRVVKLEEEEK